MAYIDIQKAFRIKRCVVEYFEKHHVPKIQAKELMPDLIKADIFKKNHKDGLPIREFLRELDREGMLKLIPQARYEQKDKNKNWYFDNITI